MDSLSGVDAVFLLMAVVLEYTFRVWFAFGKVGWAVGSVTRAACFS